MAEAKTEETKVEETEETPEQPVEPSKPTEEVQEPESEPEAPAEEVAEEEPKEEEKPPSRRENLRIQTLLQRNADLQKQIEEKPQGIDYKTALDADPEVIAQLEADRKQVAETQYNRGLEQAKSIQFHTRLEVDAPRVEGKYAQLNKESDQIDPVIANALNTHYLQLVGYDSKTDTVQNPNLRYADYIDAQYELAGALASGQIEKTSKNIAKQAATTGIRPDGSQAKRMNLNRPPEEMTDDELKAVIGQTIPELKK